MRGMINGGFQSSNKHKGSMPEKTKRYKCIEIIDEDEETSSLEQIPAPHVDVNKYKSFPIHQEHSGGVYVPLNPSPYVNKKKEVKYVTMPHFNTERPRVILTTIKPEPIPVTIPPKVPIPEDVPKDSQNRPLLLSPDHCKMIKKYSDMYMVKNIREWAHTHCSFARMYLPSATCAEIDILVDSCFKQNFITDS
uniref:Ground-like domain-containing protein n=1 Tax=Rhabditophanes sp. KR3021 TaxID=114890 RepID=A0AC35U9Z0_9BILA